MIIYLTDSSLSDVISSLPGIKNVSCNTNNIANASLMIFFNVSGTDIGLFLLTRCCDIRYWKYGDKWKIELSIGDTIENDILPITYMLHSGEIKGENAVKQSYDLIENMNYHLNHIAFLEGFNLNRNIFVKEYLSYIRKLKLKQLNDYKHPI